MRALHGRREEHLHRYSHTCAHMVLLGRESAGLTSLSACWGGSVAGSTDGTVRVWGPKTGLCKHVFNGHGFHDGPITAIASHHEGALLLSGALAWSVLRL